MKRSFSDINPGTDATPETKGRVVLEVGIDTKGFFICWICRIDPTVGEKGLGVRVLFGVTMDGPVAVLDRTS